MMKKMMTVLVASMIAIALAHGKNVDLSTVPGRDSVQLTIYNSEDLTLVRETRVVTFKQGMNPLQFSWAGTLIDPTSVDIRFRTQSGDLDLMDTTFPHDRPQTLYWNVQSAVDIDAVVEITYFTSGITWSADYRCVSDTEETRMSLDGYVKITNNSGEDYAGAQIRLVVGTINLVEKVTHLAERGILSERDADDYREGKKRLQQMPAVARREMMDAAAKSMVVAESMAPKDIVKEGLSEYFIFTIPGVESVPHTWSKRMRLFEGREVPFAIHYRYRVQQYGDMLARIFLLRNDESSGLGTTPLPDGVVRVYRDNGRDGLSFLAAQNSRYVPIGQEIELNLGADPEVVHERVRLKSFRDNFWFHRHGASIHVSPGEGHRIQMRDTIAGWDDHQRWIDRIRNYRDKPIDVEIRRSFDGHVIFESSLSPVLHDYRTPRFSASVPAGEHSDLSYELTFRQGYNKKQDNVTLRSAR
ncbi:MAG: DUF4139 domain-containing protein [Acidobacteriota bacterium]|nr:DUF4139 domain-containing protein [Acidobacteriota bacterium]